MLGQKVGEKVRISSFKSDTKQKKSGKESETGNKSRIMWKKVKKKLTNLLTELDYSKRNKIFGFFCLSGVILTYLQEKLFPSLFLAVQLTAQWVILSLTEWASVWLLSDLMILEHKTSHWSEQFWTMTNIVKFGQLKHFFFTILDNFDNIAIFGLFWNFWQFWQFRQS